MPESAVPAAEFIDDADLIASSKALPIVAAAVGLTIHSGICY
jgi:hypothetical protein